VDLMRHHSPGQQQLPPVDVEAGGLSHRDTPGQQVVRVVLAALVPKDDRDLQQRFADHIGPAQRLSQAQCLGQRRQGRIVLLDRATQPTPIQQCPHARQRRQVSAFDERGE
jgi:hypothetical protein